MARRKRDPNDLPIPEKILTAAARLFSKLGAESASMKMIAEEAGITAAALYYHFENKDEIVYQTLHRAVAGLLAATTPAMALLDDDPVEALRLFAERHVLFLLTDLETVAPVYNALVHGLRRQENVLAPERREALRAAETTNFDNLKRILATGAKRGLFHTTEPTLTAFAIVGMCEHTTNWFSSSGRRSAAQVARFMGDAAVVMASAPASIAPAKRASRAKVAAR